MENKEIQMVDEYIANAPKETRPKLIELRSVIKSTIPQVKEEILWGYPFYKYHGILAGISAYKKHVAFKLQTPFRVKIEKHLKRKVIH